MFYVTLVLGLKALRVYTSLQHVLSKLFTILTNTSKFLIRSCYQRCLFTDQWTSSSKMRPRSTL